MMWLSLLTGLRRVPGVVWLLIGAALVLTVELSAIGDYGDAREAAGFARARQGAVFDSTVAATFARTRERVVLRTDTLVQRITVTRQRVDTLIAALPATTKQLRPVRELVGTVQLLTRQVDSLTMQIDAERATHTMEREVLAAQTTALRAVVAGQADSIRTLQRRPTWRRTVGLTLGGAALGVLGGWVWR